MNAAPHDTRPIALVGMMGAGKTSIGRALAQRLGRPFRDLDQEVERAAGVAVAELFEHEGEAAFRVLEHRALARVLDGASIVLATGGGAVLDLRNRQLLRQHALTIWLDAAPATLARRVSDDGTRPLLADSDPEARLDELLAERRALYSGADLRFDANASNIGETLRDLLALLGLPELE